MSLIGSAIGRQLIVEREGRKEGRLKTGCKKKYIVTVEQSVL